MIDSIMKTIFQKLKPCSPKIAIKIVQHGDYTSISNDNYRRNILQNLPLENVNTNIKVLEKFPQICVNTLVQMAPKKEILMW